MSEFYKNKVFLIVLSILIVGSVLIKYLPNYFANKEETCEQIAFKAKKYELITNNIYFSKKLQKICVKQWDEKQNPEWRECVLDADSNAELLKCTPPPYIYIALKNYR